MRCKKRGMMKVSGICRLAAMLLLMLAVLAGSGMQISAVWADVIYIPGEGTDSNADDFYDSHREQCVFVGGTAEYEALADTEWYETPDMQKKMNVFEEGAELHIYVRYTDADGRKWGLVDDPAGWVPLDTAERIFDLEALREEKPDQIDETTGTFTVPEEETVACYLMPGEKAEWQISKLALDQSDRTVEYSLVYTDDQGVQWAYIPVLEGYKGYSDFWVDLQNLTEPIEAEDAALYERSTPKPQEISDTEDGEQDDLAGDVLAEKDED